MAPSYAPTTTTNASTAPILMRPLSDAVTDEEAVPKPEYITSNVRVAVIMVALCVGAFLISLDRTIITVATPAITAHFHSTSDTGWYASAYLIASCAFLPLFGKLYTFADPKWVYICSCIVFSVGSALCGFAPSSLVLILGRAVAGLGSAGMFSGTLIIAARSVEPERRVLLMAIGGLTLSLASIVGPIIGGGFTAGPGWRYCFIINLPLTAALCVGVVAVLKLPPTAKSSRPWPEELRSFDFVGASLLLGAAVMLLLALHYAAADEPWSSSRITGLLVGSAVTTTVLAIWLWRHKDEAIIPLRLITNRSVASGCSMALGLYGGLTTLIFYLPVYFQAAMNMSASQSAVALLPYLLSTALSAIVIAVITTRTPLPQMTAIALFSITGCAAAIIGAGLLTLLTASTNNASIIGFQLLFGLGMGVSIQQGQNALQFTLSSVDLPTAMTLITFCQSLGGAVAVAVANAIFLAVLRGAKPGVPEGTTAERVIAQGYRAFRQLPGEFVGAWEEAYTEAIRATFLLVLGLASVAFVGACLMGTGGLVRKKREA